MKTIVAIAITPELYRENEGLCVLAETVAIDGLELALHESVEEDDPGYTVSDPITGGRMGQGSTPAAAIANAKDRLWQAEQYHQVRGPELLWRCREAFRFAH